MLEQPPGVMGVSISPQSAFAYGERVADLAERFVSRCDAEDISVVALKGVALAEELYGSFADRPVADADLLVIDLQTFDRAVTVAKDMGLRAFDVSDHVVALREEGTRAVIEVHASLTSSAAAFCVRAQSLWDHRRPVPGRSFNRLSNEDAVIHMALHAVFQHGLSVKAYHFEDFSLAFERFPLSVPMLEARAREFRASRVLGAMFVARQRLQSGASAQALEEFSHFCPEPLRHWIAYRWNLDAPISLPRLFFVRWHVTHPSRRTALVRTALFPTPLPGTTPRSATKRLQSLMRRSLGP